MRLFIAEKPDLAKAIVAALSGEFKSYSNQGTGYTPKAMTTSLGALGIY